MLPIRWSVHSPGAMFRLGEAFGRACGGGEVFLLHGPLGSGKTQWVKGLGSGLGVPGVINSPSFTLVRPYQGRLRLHHVDLFRLSAPGDCQAIDLDAFVGPDSVVAVEWADRCPKLLERAVTLELMCSPGLESERAVICHGDVFDIITKAVEIADSCEGVDRR